MAWAWGRELGEGTEAQEGKPDPDDLPGRLPHTVAQRTSIPGSGWPVLSPPALSLAAAQSLPRLPSGEGFSAVSSGSQVPASFTYLDHVLILHLRLSNHSGQVKLGRFGECSGGPCGDRVRNDVTAVQACCGFSPLSFLSDERILSLFSAPTQATMSRCPGCYRKGLLL